MKLNSFHCRHSFGEHRTIALFGNPEMRNSEADLQAQMERKDSGQESQKKSTERREKLTEDRLGERMASTLKRFEGGTKARQDRLTQVQNRVGQTQKIAALDHPHVDSPQQTQEVRYETKEQFESRKRANDLANVLVGEPLLSSEKTEVQQHGPDVRTVNAPGAAKTGAEQQAKAAPSASAQSGAKLAADSGEKKAAQQKTVAETGVPEAQGRRTT